MKENLINFLKNYDIFKGFDINELIEVPKDKKNGDFTLKVFQLSKQLKKPPVEIAKDLVLKLSKEKPSFISEIKNVGGYINFYIDTKYFLNFFINSFLTGNLFKFETKNESILLEYPSPNANKSLHIGHVRNLILGNSISKILKKAGYNVVKVNLSNDRGIAICKAMVSYSLFGNGKTPYSENIKPDKFVSYYYSLFEKKKEDKSLNLEEKAQECLRKWENGDKETRKLWKKIINWVYEGFEITYKRYKYQCDKTYYESDIYDKGKETIIDALNKGVEGFKKDEKGAIYIDLTNEGLDKKYLLRGDGTTLYITQDIYLAKLKQEEFNCNKYIYIVGKEQKYHFDVLFKVLERLGIKKQNNFIHFAYGYVFDKDGKKFSSREGRVIDADEILNLCEEKAYKLLLEKGRDSKLNNKAKVIGYSVLAFNFLKVNPLNDIFFDIEKASSLEGETGPYILYTYARILSILRKSDLINSNNFEEFFKSNGKRLVLSKFNEAELNIIKLLFKFKEIIETAALSMKPSDIATYVLKISQRFNEYYSKYSVLKESDEETKFNRLFLIFVTSQIIKELLDLLDIEVLEEL